MVILPLTQASDKISFNSDSLTDFAQASGSSGSTSKPTFSFSSDDNSGLYNPTNDNLGLVVGGSEALRILANGNVGLGVTNPTEKLVVQW